MGSSAIQALIAGFGKGAGSLGMSIGQREEEDQKATAAELASQRALQRLLTVEQAKAGDQSVWGNAFPAEDESGPGLFQENKRTGDVRRVQVGSTANAPATAPGPTADTQGADAAMIKLAGQPPVRGGLKPVAKPTAPRDPVIGSPEWQEAERFRASLRQPPKPTLHEVTLPDGTKELRESKPGLVTNAQVDKEKPTPALMIASMNRLGLAEGDISDAIDQMERFENDPNSRAKMTAWKQALAAGAQVTPDPHPHGVLGAVNNMGGAAIAGGAQKLLQADPELRRYMRNAQVVGTAATEILPRPNQQLLAIERGLSGIDVGWNPEMTADIQNRRRRMRDMLHESLKSTPLGKTLAPARAVGPSTPSPSGEKPAAKPTAQAGHTALSDADFARAWQAGKRTDAEIATWVAANPKPNDE